MAGMIAQLLFGASDPDTRPYAYLNYLIFDEQFNSIDAGAMRVPQTAGFDPGFELLPHQEVKFQPVAINTTGYMYVWVSNESEATKVWFDDLSIVHHQSIVTQATDYGVWGEVLREQKTNVLDGYRYGYQGQFAEKDEDTGWNHFEAREFDPNIGRWTSTDPARQFSSPYLGLGNNPINALDTDGRLIIFVNGFHAGWFSPSGRRYWGGFGRDIATLFGERFDTSLFPDGDIGDLAPGLRKFWGRIWAQENIESIRQSVEETHQLIVVSHSMGGAFAQGIVEYLGEQGIKTDLHVTYAPYQDWAIGDVGDTQTLHFTNQSDWVSGTSLNVRGSNVDGFVGSGSHFINSFRWTFPVIRNWFRTKAQVEVGTVIQGKELQDFDKSNKN